jgi:hypothetical protein
MKGLFGFLIMAIVMVCVSYANATETKTSQDDTPVPKPKDVSIIVDRNPKVQELKVYENGELTHTMPISTGRETFDFNEGNYKINPYCSFTQTNEEFALTEDGKKTDASRFKVQRLREMNVSDTWSTRDNSGNITSKTRMPHAVFFNGGTAFHAVDIDTEYGKKALKKLGPKDNAANGGSGACVRLSPENAKIVFDLFATKKADGSYEKADPREWDECKVAPGQTMSHKCTDPEQWPVPRKKLDVEIKIQDSRTAEEQAAAHKKCNDMEAAFLSDKAKCLESKIKPQTTSAPVAEEKPKKKKGFFQKIFGNFFNSKQQNEDDESIRAVADAPYNFVAAWAQVPSEDRIKYNAECNRAGHDKIKKGELGTSSSPAAPVKPKKDKPKEEKTAPKKPKTAPSPDGLWM